MKSNAALIRSQLFVELRNTVRNGEQLLLLVVIPIAVFLVTRRNDANSALNYALTTGVMAANLTSLAIATAFERRWGVLKSYATSPLSLPHVIVAKSLSALCISLIQALALSVLAADFRLNNFAAAVTATIALAPWALLMATTLKAERVLALANLAFLILVGSLWLDSPIVTFTPTGAVWSVTADDPVLGVIIATLWGGIGSLLTMRRGRWTE